MTYSVLCIAVISYAEICLVYAQCFKHRVFWEGEPALAAAQEDHRGVTTLLVWSWGCHFLLCLWAEKSISCFLEQNGGALFILLRCQHGQPSQAPVLHSWKELISSMTMKDGSLACSASQKHKGNTFILFVCSFLLSLKVALVWKDRPKGGRITVSVNFLIYSYDRGFRKKNNLGIPSFRGYLKMKQPLLPDLVFFKTSEPCNIHLLKSVTKLCKKREIKLHVVMIKGGSIIIVVRRGSSYPRQLPCCKYWPLTPMPAAQAFWRRQGQTW